VLFRSPKEGSGLFYINTQNLIDIINFAYPQINDIYLSYLKPIKAMGFTSESSKNEITNYGFLLIE
jgi:flagellar motor switch protein FliG